MTIAISLPDDFSIENYEGLQTFLIDHLELDAGTQAQLANLIRLAELRLSRALLAPGRDTTGTVATVSGTQTVSLPSDFAQMRQLRIAGDNSTGYPLEAVTLNTVEAYDYSGKPTVYAIHGDTIILGPIPDAAYTLNLRYEQKLTALTDNSQTNWVLANHADAYVYMAAAVISLHMLDRETAALYSGLAEGVVEEINREGNRRRNSTPMRIRSAVVV